MSFLFSAKTSPFDEKTVITNGDLALRILSRAGWREVADLAPIILTKEWFLAACKIDETVFATHCRLPAAIRKEITLEILSKNQDYTNVTANFCSKVQDMMEDLDVSCKFVARWPDQVGQVAEKIRYNPLILMNLGNNTTEEYLVVACTKDPLNFMLCQARCSLDTCKAAVLSFPSLFKICSVEQKDGIKVALTEKYPLLKEKFL